MHRQKIVYLNTDYNYVGIATVYSNVRDMDALIRQQFIYMHTYKRS